MLSFTIFLRIPEDLPYNESFTGHAKIQLNRTAFPRSPSPRLLQICLASAKRSRRHAIYWRCLDGNSPMTRPDAVYRGSIIGFWPSLNNFRTSPPRKSEERFSDQSTEAYF
jgi:hypothetical protein